MRFEQYQYLWPPRPENAIQRPVLKFYQNRGFVAQAKKNGTCSIVAVSPDKNLVTMTRHNEPHKLWKPSPKSSAAFQKLSGDGWYVFVCELLHSKVPGITDINYINDILVDDGAYLVGTTFVERQGRLKQIFWRKGMTESDTHYVINPNTWLAKLLTGDFGNSFDRLDRPEDEGLVLKNPNASLQMCLKASSNVDWQVKIRRSGKNYGF